MSNVHDLADAEADLEDARYDLFWTARRYGSAKWIIGQRRYKRKMEEAIAELERAAISFDRMKALPVVVNTFDRMPADSEERTP